MDKIISTEMLLERADKLAKQREAFSEGQQEVLICSGGGCIASGAMKLKDALIESIATEDALHGSVIIRETGCLGPCVKGPILKVEADGTLYQNVQPSDAAEIVRDHLAGGKVIERLVMSEPVDKGQTRIVMRNSGKICPTSLGDYLSVGGYGALAKAIGKMTIDDVMEEVKKSGLRGRGGAGFPTWMKWSFARKQDKKTKYVLCNADEGDPGAFMDRSVLEGDPHSLIEGMALAAYVIGAEEGFVYVRAEYPLAVERLNKAIADATEAGILGQGILGTDFNFTLEIRKGSGAFVCGEETALIHSIEGKRGEPRPRPPFPPIEGLWRKPTVLNNVETYANIAPIIENGGDWFASVGTEKSKGTKVFALAGAIENSGLVEVPIGTPLGEIIYDIGGGVPNNKTFKAAQIGGPSGGCVPKNHLDVPLDYESLQEIGAIMGSGGLVVMDDDTCMVDVARFFMEFVQEESCGKCAPCRIGTKRMLEILERICAGQGKMSDIDMLKELSVHIKDTALCGLGQTAPNPVLSTLEHFGDEYEEHIRRKNCPAGVCPGLVIAPCNSACPASVNIPGFVSLVGEKRYAEALRLHRERNPYASVCARVCFHVCEDHCRRSAVDESVAIRGVKRHMVDQEVTIQVPEIRDDDENAAKKIAIIGAGPSGYSCAYFLARLGYQPEVFEAQSRPGGMLVQTIPAYRLPRELLARENRMIEGLGVTFVGDSALGRDFTLADLKAKGYEAVYVAVGQPEGVILNMPGKDAEGVTEAIEFLRQYNLRGSVPVGKEVVVIGGGNSAIDAARTALRLGADVKVVYRRTQAEMPAYEEEIQAAIEEGVTILHLTNPKEIMTVADKVVGVRCAKMVLGGYDSSGRRRPMESEEVVEIQADQVIFAVGQTMDAPSIFGPLNEPTDSNSYEYSVNVGEEILTMDGKSRVEADSVTGRTSIDWIFAGGDVATGASSVVEAVACGERAAVGIDEFITGERHAFWRAERAVDTAFDPDAEPETYRRKQMPMLDVERRKNNFAEVEHPWVASEAIRQAQRCLRCDYGKYVATEEQ